MSFAGLLFWHTLAKFVGDIFDGCGSVNISEEHLPGFWSLVDDSTVFVKFAIFFEFLLLLGEWTELPLLVVGVSIHDDSLGPSDDAVITSSHGGSSHLSDCEGNCLSLCGDEDDLLATFDIGFISQNTWQHELRTVTDGVDRSVLDDNSWVVDQKDLEWHNDSSEILLFAVLLEMPLGIFDVVHSDHGFVLFEGTASYSPELGHVCTTSEKVTDMNAKSSNIGTSLATDPEDTHVSLFVVLEKFGFINGSYSELFFDGRDKWWPLEAGASERLESLFKFLDLVDLAVKFDDSNVLFTSGLLSLNKSSSIVNASDKATGDFWIERTTMASLINLQDSLDPGNDLVTTWVRWLIKVDDTVLLEDVDWSSKW